VIRESSSTTKLRVAFNASCQTRNGTSLNYHLLVGPKLQQDLLAIVARWRQWRYGVMLHCGHHQNVPSDIGRTYGCRLPADTLAIEPRISAATLPAFCTVTIVASASYTGTDLVLLVEGLLALIANSE